MTMATSTNRSGRTGGRNRRLSAVARSFVAVLTLSVTLAQFFALSHEVAVRHFRCAEHGEVTHVAVTSAEDPLPAPRSTDAFRRGEPDASGGHEHCGFVFTVQGGASWPVVAGAVRVAPPPSDRPPPAVLPSVGRSRAFVLASAPKTSPPAVRS
jgi:hypothetical protein